MPQTNRAVRGSDKLADLERRVNQLLYGRRLESSSITDGSLDVIDGNGDTRVVMGRQSDGSYGISLKEPDGRTVGLSQLAFGTTTVSADGSVTRTGVSAANDTAVITDPVRITGGYAVVLTSARMIAGDGTAGGIYDCAYSHYYNVVRDDGVPEDENWSEFWGPYMSLPTGSAQQVMQTTAAKVHTGLAPGYYTFGARFHTWNTTGKPTYYSYRSLTVLPF